MILALSVRYKKIVDISTIKFSKKTLNKFIILIIAGIIIEILNFAIKLEKFSIDDDYI